MKREIEKLKDMSDKEYFVLFRALTRYQNILARGMGDNDDKEPVDRLVRLMSR